MATGRISAVANTQSSIDCGRMARNNLRMAGDSPCVTPSTSPLLNNFAVASSALAHTIHGDLNLVTLSEVNSIVKGDTSGRVQR